jgi:hypothetical protein
MTSVPQIHYLRQSVDGLGEKTDLSIIKRKYEYHGSLYPWVKYEATKL